MMLWILLLVIFLALMGVLCWQLAQLNGNLETRRDRDRSRNSRND